MACRGKLTVELFLKLLSSLNSILSDIYLVVYVLMDFNKEHSQE